MKTGWQAKSEAANVFNAVLKSVTECEKLTHSLQEVKAYSKLYYQRRVKSMVDNRLKAEAEVLQAENKALYQWDVCSHCQKGGSEYLQRRDK
jgi:NMD protein affecting ribosome stability and mRNA decay